MTPTSGPGTIGSRFPPPASGRGRAVLLPIAVRMMSPAVVLFLLALLIAPPIVLRSHAGRTDVA